MFEMSFDSNPLIAISEIEFPLIYDLKQDCHLGTSIRIFDACTYAFFQMNANGENLISW